MSIPTTIEKNAGKIDIQQVCERSKTEITGEYAGGCGDA